MLNWQPYSLWLFNENLQWAILDRATDQHKCLWETESSGLTSLSTSDFLVMQSNQLHLVRCALLLLCDEIILQSIALTQVKSDWRSEVKWSNLTYCRQTKMPMWPVTMTIHAIDKSLCVCGRYGNAGRPTGNTQHISQSSTTMQCGKI